MLTVSNLGKARACSDRANKQKKAYFCRGSHFTGGLIVMYQT